jgi:hypothetical protein
MNKYKIIEDSVGPKRSFSITVGLNEGYDSPCSHNIYELIWECIDWMIDRVEKNLPYLPGMWKTADMCYVHNGHQIIEPVAIFCGEVNHLYNSNLKDNDIEEMLNELASVLGSTTNQTRVYLSFCDKMWILEKE